MMISQTLPEWLNMLPTWGCVLWFVGMVVLYVAGIAVISRTREVVGLGHFLHWLRSLAYAVF